MNNVMPALEAGVYLDRDSFQLEENADNYLYMTVHRKPKKSRESAKADSTDEDHGAAAESSEKEETMKRKDVRRPLVCLCLMAFLTGLPVLAGASGGEGIYGRELDTLYDMIQGGRD